MAKRFTDTGKWGEKWFYGLSPYSKLLFNYLCDICDNAGFYEVNEERLAADTKIPTDQIQKCFAELSKSVLLVDGRIWIRNFVKHQKNLPLNPKNNAHKNIITLIEESGGYFVHLLEFVEFSKHLPIESQNKLAPKQPLNRGPGIGIGNGIGNGNIIKSEEILKFSIDPDENKILQAFADIMPKDREPSNHHLRTIKGMRTDFGDKILLLAIQEAGRRGLWSPDKIREIALELLREDKKQNVIRSGETKSVAEIIAARHAN